MTLPTYLETYEVFPFAPLLPIRERLTTETNVLKAKDGTEQRIAVRPAPRQSFDMNFYFNDNNLMSRLDALLFGWQKTYLALPIWTERTVHTGAISAGASTISLDTANADYRDAALAVVWQSETSYEVVLVDTVEASQLVLDGTMQSGWSGQKYVMPCRLAQISSPVKYMQYNAFEGVRKATFDVVDNEQLSGWSADATYPESSGATSYDVVADANVVRGGQEGQSDADVSIQDYASGGFEYFSYSDYNVLTRSYRRRNDTMSKCWDFRLMLHSFYGRQVPKWFPTFRHDLQLISAINPTDTSFLVQNAGLVGNMGLNTLRTHVAFVLSNGSRIYRQVTSIDSDPSDNEKITIDSSLGATVQTTDTISWLDLCRLASDNVEIDWQEPNVNECNLTLLGVAA